MAIDITSANSKLHIVVPAFYPGGFDVDDYAAEDMFDTGAIQNAEDMMSADGKYHAGFIFNPTELTITLMATSNAAGLIGDWYSAERTAISKFACNAVLTIPSLNIKYNFVNGILYTWTPTPPGKRVLQPRPAVFHFESCTPSAA
ncbi:phage tail fiber protein (plasmid) [Rahnella variigena]|uniref:phage tail fiber protein n=1 Tax=Rahnella TaxID=34037 RepID=UPI0039AF2285